MRHLHDCAKLFAAALCCLQLSTAAVNAAPDNTLGMAMLGAVIAGDGTTLTGVGLTTSQRASMGNYVLTFDRNLAGCTFAAAPLFITGGTTSVVVPRLIQVPSTANVQFNVNKVSDGTLVDHPFSVIVFCSR